MIPISRRTIAWATARWRVFGKGLEVELAQLLLGGAGAGQLGQEGDEQRQRAVEVVEVRGLPSREDEDQSQHRLDHDRDLGHPQRVPEADGRLLAQPGDPAPDPGHQVGRDQGDAAGDVERRSRGPP